MPGSQSLVFTGGFMKIVYGAEVEDRHGNKVGQVNQVIRDSWTGNIRKFGVWQEGDVRDKLVSPEDIGEIKEDKIVLAITLEENG